MNIISAIVYDTDLSPDNSYFMATDANNTWLFKYSKSSMRVMRLGLNAFVETTISKWNDTIIVNLTDF